MNNNFIKGAYFNIALKGIAWSTLLKGAMRIITFARIAILARILSPAQFGVFGIATLVLSLIEIFTETGINVFLIQHNEGIKKYLSTAWIVSIVRGFIIAIIIAISSPFIANFFDSANATSILMLTSLIPLIRGFINPAIVKFQKDLSFDKEFFFRLPVFLIESIVVISVAFFTRSEISLVVGLIISAIFEVFISFLFVSPIPRFVFNQQIFKKIIGSGKWVTLSGIANYSFENIDDIVVGKILGTSSLGLYQMAYKISILPITEISDVIAKVAFPIFVKIADDTARLRRAYLKTLLIITVFSTCFGVIAFLFTHQIVELLLGKQWLEIVPLLKVLIVFGVIRAISGSPAMLFLAVKKQKYISHFTSLSLALLVLTIFPAVNNWGLIGASYSALFASLLTIPLTTFYLYKVLALHSK